MPPLTLLIKPASASCNMRCRYCFYSDIVGNSGVASYGIMGMSTLENVVKKSLDFASGQCTFVFQGGEPTLAKQDFYKAFLELATRHNHKKLQTNYSIQTNGYGIDREWADFLAKNHFLVGLSLDGIKDVHDLYRKDAEEKGTFAKVMRTAQIFNHYGVEYNILTVITNQVAKSIGKVYGFFKRNHFIYQQYIPCLDPLGENRGQYTYSLYPKLYGDFLCNLFDLWYNDFSRGNRVFIRYFDNLMQLIMRCPPESCGMMGTCTRQIVVEADGSVYPCDFYVLDKYRLGNLNDNDFLQIEAKRDSTDFIEVSKQISTQCLECRWYFLCRGGCRRDRESLINSELSINYFCSSYMSFFDYAFSRLKKCAYSL